MKKLIRRFVIGLGAIALTAWLIVTRPFVFTMGTPVSKAHVDPENLKRHVETISNEFFPRNWTHPENLNKTAHYIMEEFKKTNANVHLQNFMVGSTQYSNVISEYGVSRDDGIMVIGAHYDACDELPGADDNASGVAGLIELGSLLSRENLPFKVLLVGYTLEEPPFFKTNNMGSAVHAASLAAEGIKVRLMISLETIGYFSDEYPQHYPIPILKLFYPSRGNFIAIVGGMTLSTATIDMKRAFSRSVTLPVRSINAPAMVPGIDFSDHLNYWNNNFDAVMITDTAFLRNLEYHQPGDTADRLNYERMSEVVLGVHSYIVGE